MLNIPDDSEAFWALFAEELSRPLPPIPLEDTPIYAQLRIEHDEREHLEAEYGTAWVKVLPDLTKFREQRKPLLKNGRRR